MCRRGRRPFSSKCLSQARGGHGEPRWEGGSVGEKVERSVVLSKTRGWAAAIHEGERAGPGRCGGA